MSNDNPLFSSLVPMLPVTDVQRTIDFYEQLGFQVGNRHAPEGETRPVWAWLYCGNANLMLSLNGKAVEATHDGAAIWLYCKDVVAMHESLKSRGLDVGEVSYPFYNPRGEFHVHDPDGYAVFISHTGE
jgi:catechol 2,3-dioxygenase-like lactoylglutathione lyase family enzyme